MGRWREMPSPETTGQPYCDYGAMHRKGREVKSLCGGKTRAFTSQSQENNGDPKWKGYPLTFLHPREMLRRPKLENSALLLVSQRLSGSFEGCQKPDAPGPCLTYLGTSCPIWSLLWTGQRPKADLVHTRSSSCSQFKGQHTVLCILPLTSILPCWAQEFVSSQHILNNLPE